MDGGGGYASAQEVKKCPGCGVNQFKHAQVKKDGPNKDKWFWSCDKRNGGCGKFEWAAGFKGAAQKRGRDDATDDATVAAIAGLRTEVAGLRAMLEQFVNSQERRNAGTFEFCGTK